MAKSGMKQRTRSRDMRKVLLAACAIACLGVPAPASAGSYNAQGQFVGAISPGVLALLRQFPQGGPGLRAAVARLLEVNPALADDVVAAARRGNHAQKEAMGEGLADASLYFAKCGSDFCKGYEAQIRWAERYADDETKVGIIEGEAPTFVGGIPGFNKVGGPVNAIGLQTNGCVGVSTSSVVSPSGPSPSPSSAPGC
jgi:hypothetical protein